MTRAWKRRIIWRVITWVWIFPVLLIPVAWEVTPVGWVIIGFLIIGWGFGIYLQVRAAYRWAISFDSKARLSALTLRATWPVMAARANLLDSDENGPRLTLLQPAPAGWRATLEAYDHSRELNAIDNHRGVLTRWIGVQSMKIEDKGAGTIELRGFIRDPLEGVRETIGVGAKYKHGIRIGRKEEGGDLALNLINAAGHIALQGATRSGKSVTSYCILSQCAADRRIEVWGIDPTGVLLSPWKGQPGVRATGLADLDAVTGVIDKALETLTLRLAELDLLGTDKIEPDRKHPLVLMVLEEWPGTIKALKDADGGLKPPERREGRVRAGVSRLVAEGAKVGIKVMMIAQRFDASIIGGAERSNIAYRITHRVDNGDAVRMLHEGSTPELIETVVKLAPGRAIAEWPGETPEVFQADWIEYADYRSAVAAGTKIRDQLARAKPGA